MAFLKKAASLESSQLPKATVSGLEELAGKAIEAIIEIKEKMF